MIDPKVLRLIDDEVLEMHVYREFIKEVEDYTHSLKKRLERKYHVKFITFYHDGFFDFERLVSYYDPRLQEV